MSVAVSLSRPRACSGDQYSGVPSSIPWVVTLVEERAIRASPKSETTTRPVALSISTLPGREVAVDDPAGVRVGERRRDRAGDLGSLLPAEGPAARDLAEARSLDELHHEKRRLAVLAVVVEAHDVLVLERGENARLARETPPELGILGDPGVEQLDRDVAPQAAVMGAPDGSHASLADASTQLVAAGDEVGHTRESARFQGELRREPSGL